MDLGSRGGYDDLGLRNVHARTNNDMSTAQVDYQTDYYDADAATIYSAGSPSW